MERREIRNDESAEDLAPPAAPPSQAARALHEEAGPVRVAVGRYLEGDHEDDREAQEGAGKEVDESAGRPERKE